MNTALTALTFVLVSCLVVGCAQDTGEDDASEGGSEQNFTQFVADSSFTDLWSESCKTVSESDESDATTVECPSSSPAYRLSLFSGDLRERATLVGPGNSEHAIAPFELVAEGAQWNTLGPKAEWRSRQGDAAKPYALILRHVFENPETHKKQHYLVVTKIVGGNMCLAGIVEASANAKNANVLARNIADASRTKEQCPAKIAITTR
jgi:hypothetical protein